MGIDQDGDGQFEEGKEPKTYVRVSRIDYIPQAVVKEDEIEHLQALLSGT